MRIVIVIRRDAAASRCRRPGSTTSRSPGDELAERHAVASDLRLACPGARAAALRSREELRTTIGRSDSVCGQIGASTSASSSGYRIGPPQRERIGGRAGRRRDDQAVAAVRVHVAAVDPGFEIQHAAGLPLLQHDVVQRLAAAIGLARRAQRRAAASRADPARSGRRGSRRRGRARPADRCRRESRAGRD